MIPLATFQIKLEIIQILFCKGIKMMVAAMKAVKFIVMLGCIIQCAQSVDFQTIGQMQFFHIVIKDLIKQFDNYMALKNIRNGWRR